MKAIFSLFAILAMICSSAFAQFTNETEVGIAAANGNTRTQTYTASQQNQYKWDKDTVGFKARYLNAKAQEEETARYFMGSLRYERSVSSRLGIFGMGTFEKDRFANIDQRRASDIGGRYHFIESEKENFLSDLGYRYLHEDRLDGTHAYSQYGRLYVEWSKQWRESYSTKLWVEYLPNFTDQKDWLLNTEASLTVIMTEVFSLKSAFLLRNDNSPAPGVEYKTDTLFTTAIVAKF